MPYHHIASLSLAFFIFRLREPSSTCLLVKSSRGPDPF
nr:MAG TPA: hypothetical protein [Caudoviricetes sp.]